MDKQEVKMSEWISQGFDLYKASIGPFLIMSLLAMLISIVTLGILSGPMMAGLALAALRALRGDKNLQAGDVFKGFDYFLPSFLLFLVWGLIMFAISVVLGFIPCIGNIIGIIISFAIQTITMLGIFVVVDQKMDFWPASMKVVDAIKSNPGPFLAFGIVASLIGSLGAALCGIGVILTIPLGICIFASAYQELFAGGNAIPAQATEVPPAEPPPPPQA